MCGYFKYLLCIFIILLFHDIGHITFLKKLGYKIDKIEILPFGANIETNLCLNSKSFDILIISFAGVLFQIILYFIFIIFLKLNLISINFYNIFLKYNTLLILFNLLPIYPLDGNKVLGSLVECLVSYKLSLEILNIISFINVFFLLYINYLLDLDNFAIVIFLMFKVIFNIKNQKYIFNKFLIERILYKYKQKRIKNVSTINKIYKNKLNFINGINERKILLKKFNK